MNNLNFAVGAILHRRASVHVHDSINFIGAADRGPCSGVPRKVLVDVLSKLSIQPKAIFMAVLIKFFP